MPFDLGQLTALHQELAEDIPEEFHTFHADANGTRGAAIDDKAIADKAAEDAKAAPSVWFVNFPTPGAAANKALLAKYMQDVQDYRCWASLIWWRTVYNQAKIPQDPSAASKARRNAYCAVVATKHMTLTPWLAIKGNTVESKGIKCKVTDFHTELITAVLKGFIIPSKGIVDALEKILESLRETINSSSGNTDSRTIVCERYEYFPEADVIRSSVRIISFTVTDSMKNVQNAKKTEREVTCTIDYTDYEADFNHKIWLDAAGDISEEQKKATKKFVGDQTVDCPPE